MPGLLYSEVLLYILFAFTRRRIRKEISRYNPWTSSYWLSLLPTVSYFPKIHRSSKRLNFILELILSKHDADLDDLQCLLPTLYLVILLLSSFLSFLKPWELVIYKRRLTELSGTQAWKAQSTVTKKRSSRKVVLKCVLFSGSMWTTLPTQIFMAVLPIPKRLGTEIQSVITVVFRIDCTFVR